MGWFLRLMEERDATCHVGDPAQIRKVETRRQYDRRDAALLLELLTENRFPAIWMPPSELRDLRALLRHRERPTAGGAQEVASERELADAGTLHHDLLHVRRVVQRVAVVRSRVDHRTPTTGLPLVPTKTLFLSTMRPLGPE